MTTSAELAAVIADHGIAILAPLAVIEGPIVTVVAAYMASLKLLDLGNVILCVIIADVVGDCILYAMGRGLLDWLPLSIRRKFGVSRRRMAQMIRTFRDNGVRLLVIGKLTHAVGFAVLFAAGASRMPFLTFVLANLLATIPKSLILVAIGYMFGSAHAVMAEWFSVGSAIVLGLMAATLLVLWYRRRKPAG